MKITFDRELPVTRAYQYLTHAVGPRPIGLISTLNSDGVPNLAPFSFFELVSIDPAILIFSPLRKMRDNTTKHTYENCIENPDCVIHVVTYERVHQVNLCANEYDGATDEFEKAGFTKEKATMIKPWMVKEIPIKFECRIIGMERLGDSGGAGTICKAKVLCMHIDDEILTADQMINPSRLNLVARMGGDLYTRLTKDSVFTMPKPNKIGMGFDRLPESIKGSKILTANHLGQLASFEQIPSLDNDFENIGLQFLLEQPVSEERTRDIHLIAASRLNLNMPEHAWQVLIRSDIHLPGVAHDDIHHLITREIEEKAQ